MKKSTLLAASFAALLFTTIPAAPAQADVAVSFSFFHDNLSPHGRWVTAGSYGQVWYPVGVQTGWQPYTVGHWGWGDYGWTWVSADPWGDWTYRYGTWTFQPPWGWVWVPGYVWAPAWVTWSYTNDYIGWAPIPPSFSFSVGGYFGSPVVVNRSWYCFVPRKRFVTSHNVYNVRVPVHQNQVILERSHNVTRFPVSGGVVRNEGLALRNVERASAARVQRVSAREMRAAPARIEAARISGRKVSVASPATTRREQTGRGERSRVEKNSQVERSRVDNRRVERGGPENVERNRSQNEVRREKATRPSDTRQKRERAPAPDARRVPESRPSSERELKSSDREPKSSAREREASRPSQAETRKAPPSDSNWRRPSRASQSQPETRASNRSSSREKAVRASDPRARPSAPERSEETSEARKPAPKSKSRTRPESSEKDRSRDRN